MNDCMNAEVRDRLPELLHERLDAAERASVLAHVEMCVDCRAELELLRNTRAMMVARTPRVDVNYVVQALPKSYARVARLTPHRRVWADWRVAAAVTLLVAGGTSMAVLNRGAASVPATTPSAIVAPVAAAPGTTAPAPTTVAQTPTPGESAPAASKAAPHHTDAAGATAANSAANSATAAELATAESPTATTDVGAQLGDLNEQQLQTLLKDINNLKPVPVTDPDPVTLRVTTSSSEGDDL